MTAIPLILGEAFMNSDKKDPASVTHAFLSAMELYDKQHKEEVNHNFLESVCSMKLRSALSETLTRWRKQNEKK